MAQDTIEDLAAIAAIKEQIRLQRVLLEAEYAQEAGNMRPLTPAETQMVQLGIQPSKSQAREQTDRAARLVDQLGVRFPSRHHHDIHCHVSLSSPPSTAHPCFF